MRVFLTGGTGFLGGRLAAALRERGDEVVALVRSVARAQDLEGLGCELVEGDLGADDALRRAVEGCDAAVHAAAFYRIGVSGPDLERMEEVNVRGTERVLDAATAAGVSRIVYVSTVNVFGNTRGRIVDETYERPPGEFVSAYDETKYGAHLAAEERIRRGAPVLIAQPGAVYGPGDESQIGEPLRLAQRGKLHFVTFPGLGFTAVYVDDVIQGIQLVLDRGRIGESYVLGGQPTTMLEAVRIAARAGGHSPPRLVMPTVLLRMLAPFGRFVGPLLGQPPNLRELITASDGVTYWATHEKAHRELGYTPRDLEAGLRLTAAA